MSPSSNGVVLISKSESSLEEIDTLDESDIREKSEEIEAPSESEDSVGTDEPPKATRFEKGVDWVDRKTRKVAEALNKEGHIFGLYGLMDGLSVSYSTFKLIFDVLYNDSTTSSAVAMHDWMLTPEGIVLTIAESTFLITFSIIANYFGETSSKHFKNNLVVWWPYLRDLLKGSKNAWKGVRSTMTLFHLLSGLPVAFLVLPMALFLGTLSVANRMWYRSMTSDRKKMMKFNSDLFNEIKRLTELKQQDAESYRKKMMDKTTQGMKTRVFAYFSSIYSGAIDSLYLYIGVLGLCTIMWPLLIVLTSFCAVYAISCVLTRVYDEYFYQKKLRVTHAKVELALLSRCYLGEIQRLFGKLQKLSVPSSFVEEDEDRENLGNEYFSNDLCSDFFSEEDISVDDYRDIDEKQIRITEEIHRLINELTEKRRKLQALLVLSYTEAFFTGLKSGLAAYGVLLSIVFVIAVFLILSGTAFPPALLISAVSAGLGLLALFTTYSLIHNYIARSRLRPPQEVYRALTDLTKLSEFCAKCKGSELKDPPELSMPDGIKKILDKGMELDVSMQFAFQEWLEVFRSGFSAFGKGPKSGEYIFNPLQEQDESGALHDPILLIVLSVILSMIFAFAMALRAFAKGLGRPDTFFSATNKEKMQKATEKAENQSAPQTPSTPDKGPYRFFKAFKSKFEGKTQPNTPQETPFSSPAPTPMRMDDDLDFVY